MCCEEMLIVLLQFLQTYFIDDVKWILSRILLIVVLISIFTDSIAAFIKFNNLLLASNPDNTFPLNDSRIWFESMFWCNQVVLETHACNVKYVCGYK
ncbi:hypothetical protein CAXC1_220063 [Candidatus Xenohaliotis californiensis]|uniref:Uncharacterized protein n=1 Tax=Candidatus Xenohaliotis californiensis TaxID=84677 RepID=A0ABM9N7Y0_9RICK|nr:hypothetical protein CAXC1_220063 [Candidatus Xenohaliotis californiensis]